jgi:hypothetical protein
MKTGYRKADTGKRESEADRCGMRSVECGVRSAEGAAPNAGGARLGTPRRCVPACRIMSASDGPPGPRRARPFRAWFDQEWDDFATLAEAKAWVVAKLGLRNTTNNWGVEDLNCRAPIVAGEDACPPMPGRRTAARTCAD